MGELREEMDRVRNVVYRNMPQTGVTSMMAFMFDGSKKLACFPMPFHDDEEKDEYIYVLNHIVDEMNFNTVVLVSEAWQSESNKKAPDVRPSEDPNRDEVLIFVGGTKKGDRLALSQKINRDSDGMIVSLDDPLEVRDYVSRFFDFMWSSKTQ